MEDLTFYIYSSISFISFVGFVLFTWWWLRRRAATEVFAYITFLLLFIAIDKLFMALFRYYFIVDRPCACAMISSDWWALRTVPELIILSLIIVRMARRACRTLRLERRYAGKDTCEGMRDERTRDD